MKERRVVWEKAKDMIWTEVFTENSLSSAREKKDMLLEVPELSITLEDEIIMLQRQLQDTWSSQRHFPATRHGNISVFLT
jgi:hypothetical protein